MINELKFKKLKIKKTFNYSEFQINYPPMQD